MIILTGFSASGKDSTLKELIQFGYKPIVSYTTRPMRPIESDGVEYHFITETEFKQKQEDGFFAETTSYNMVDGKVFYGSAVEDIENNPTGIVILNPDGLRQIREKGLDVISFYLDASIETLIDRLKKRGDNEIEYTRRLKADQKDFSNIRNEVDFIISANDKTPYEVAIEILDKIKEVS